MSLAKDMHKRFRDLERAGWTIEHRRAGHYKLTWISGASVFAPDTPSDRRALRNFDAEVARVQRGEPSDHHRRNLEDR